jgi:hypothetical protein
MPPIDQIDSQIINALASQQLGAPAGGDPAAAAAAAAQAGGQQQVQKDAPQTQSEQVQAEAAPKTEGDMQNAAPVEFEIDMGDGKKRRLNAKQIAATMQRYAQLNYQHQTEVAPFKDVLGIAKQVADALSASGQKVDGKAIAEYLRTAAQAYAKNPQLGAQAQGGQAQGNQSGQPADLESVFKKWEEENAASLPPGYRESQQQINQLAKQQSELVQLLKSVLQGQSGVAQAAKSQLGVAQQTQVSGLQRQVQANLAMAQQKHQLPNEAEQDFYNFAFSRGYTFEDFIDPALTDQIVSDFKNNMNSPEMDRLRQMAERRQAFTGAVDGAPGAPGAAPAKNPDRQLIDSVVGDIYAKRNIGGR